jgi:Pentapeptide repeats (8 copies)
MVLFPVRASRNQWLLGGVVVAAVVLVVGGLMYFLGLVSHDSQLLLNAAKAPEIKPVERLGLQKDMLLFDADVKIKIWVGVLQALTGFALLGGLLFTWKNLQATQAKLDVDREGQLTNRFSAATSQLGAQLKEGTPNVEARLGGIYALEWMGRDSPRLYWQIMEILAAYVRHNAPFVTGSEAARPRTDVQAVLTVFSRSDAYKIADRRPDQKLDLRYVDLRDAEFYGAHLEMTDFWGAHLAGAKFWGAVLQDTKLSKADLSGANLRAVHFARAEMDGTNFANADFYQACIQDADFSRSLNLSQEQIDSTDPKSRTHVQLPPGLHL